jgi:hypothetical protein
MVGNCVQVLNVDLAGTIVLDFDGALEQDLKGTSAQSAAPGRLFYPIREGTECR